MFNLQSIAVKLIFEIGVIVIIVVLGNMLLNAEFEIGELSQNNDILLKNESKLEKLNNNYNKQIIIVQDANIKLSKQHSVNKKEIIEQSKIFRDHNLQNILNKKPKLIVDMANEKTKFIFKNFEKFTHNFEYDILGDVYNEIN